MATGGHDFDGSDSEEEFKEGTQKTIINKYYTETVKTDSVNVSGPNTFNITVTPPLPNVFAPSYQSPDPDKDEALKDFPPKTDLMQLFNEEDLAKEIEERLLVPVARAFTTENQCRRLARELDIETWDQLLEKYNRHDDVKELAYQVMLAWKQSSDPSPTVRTLVTALRENRSHDPCRKLLNYFQDCQTSSGDNG